jgi:2-iminobutanoate/2-iminopropanoate deaminase
MSKPLGPYTPVVRAGDFIILSGQGGLLDGSKVEGGLVAETKQTMKNIEALLESMGATMGDVVKTTCFLTDMEDYAVFNEHYVAAFGKHRPSRSCVAVAELPAGFVVEIEAWAYKPQ